MIKKNQVFHLICCTVKLDVDASSGQCKCSHKTNVKHKEHDKLCIHALKDEVEFTWKQMRGDGWGAAVCGTGHERTNKGRRRQELAHFLR